MATTKKREAVTLAGHTPGPWHRHTPQHGQGWLPGQFVKDEEHRHVACVGQPRDGDPLNPDDEAVANATLIAASPDLLAACRLALPELRATDEAYSDGPDDGSLQEAIRAIEAAIAKAV